LLGTFAYCPIVRKTTAIEAAAQVNWGEKIEKVLEDANPERLSRALSYLYFKETKSSYAIERETVTGDREHRFVGVLKNAGALPLVEMLGEPFLTKLQNIIVDPRYAQPSYRETQNYIGQSMPDFSEVIHYISPPPAAVRPLMEGLLQAAINQEGLHPVIRAVLVSFTFVFIHPFEDGNGRIHRYLLHDFLARDHFTPPGILLPISATMLADERAYDAALEDFSKKILALAEYRIDGKGAMIVTNHDQLAPYYQFPDLTRQVEYLFATVAQTIQTELPAELDFLRKFDSAYAAIRQIVDMPDKKLRLLINLLRQNKGKLSKNKRPDFAELSDEEVGAIEADFLEAFQEEIE
jgi:Fic family protein